MTQPPQSLQNAAATPARDISGARRRAFYWTVATLMLVFVLALVALELKSLFWESTPGPVPYFGDLNIYRSAVSGWLHSEGLYDYAYTNPHIAGPRGFTYPPFAALVLLPTAWLPMKVLAPLWTAGTYLMVASLGWTLAVRSHPHGSRERFASPLDRPRLFAVASLFSALLLLSYPTFHDVAVGEVSLAITTLAFLDAIGSTPRRIQGLFVGLTAAVKLTPLVFIPYFLFVGQRRQAAVASGSFAVASSLAFAIAPGASITYWGRAVMDTSRVGELSSPDNKSLMGLLARWGGSGHLLLVVWLVLGLGISALALMRARRHIRSGEPVEAALVVGSLSVAVSPISWPHHQTWAVLVGIWLIVTRRWPGRWAGAATLALFCLVSPFSGIEEPHGWVMRVGDELPTLAFLLFCALGLGRTANASEPGENSRVQSLNPRPDHI